MELCEPLKDAGKVQVSPPFIPSGVHSSVPLPQIPVDLGEVLIILAPAMLRLNPSRCSSLEFLETRIAPAVFFLSATSLQIVDSKGDPHVATEAENAAQTASGATAALLLQKGDSLVFDLNNNHTIDAGEVTLLNVTAGRGMVFLTNFGDGLGGAADGGYSVDEFTGLAAGDGFRGRSFGSINGPVVTALDSSGTFTADAAGTLHIQQGALNELQVEGFIGGHVLAGGSITRLTVRHDSAPDSVLGINGALGTGEAGNDLAISFNHGATSLTGAYTAPLDGKAGGSITKSLIVGGLQLIQTGAGHGGPKGGGAGGSIDTVAVLNSPVSFDVLAGDGAKATNGRSGDGGSILSLTLGVTPAEAKDFAIEAGKGGDGMGKSAGSGGALRDVTAKFAGPVGVVSIGAADGGADYQGGNGGAGGAVSKLRLVFDGQGTSVTVSSGYSGNTDSKGGFSRAAGNISDSSVQLGDLSGAFELKAGSAGQGLTASGKGGSVTGLSVLATGTIGGRIGIFSGGGGTLMSPTGKVGASGVISNLDLEVTGSVGSIDVLSSVGGANSDAPVATNRAKPAAGGALQDVELINRGTILSSVVLQSGRGGSLNYGTSFAHHAGAGGVVKNIKVTNEGKWNGMIITSGDGGSSLGGTGTTGASGAVSNVTVTTSGSSTGGTYVIRSGGGGGIYPALSAPDTRVNGGDSGSVSKITLNDSIGSTPFEIYAGTPVSATNKATSSMMAGVGEGTKGGNVGNVTGVKLNMIASSIVTIGTADPAGDGGTGPNSAGGNGGQISGITGLVGTLDILAPDGGKVSSNEGLGTGGRGGSISNVKVTEVLKQVHMIAAGDGGAGAVGGKGGSVSKIKVAGDIGDFTAAFDLSGPRVGQGGLVAGLGGAGSSGLAANGSISSVNVGTHGIATIIAGRPAANAVSYQNAVTKITGIVAAQLGAETNLLSSSSQTGTNGGTYNFTEGGGDDPAHYEPASTGEPVDGDTAIDGLVIVRGVKGGVKLPVTPLLLIEVPVV